MSNEAPRWRLREAHYINVPGTEWEYKETDRTSGRQGRKLFEVPRFLDPRDAADHNYPGVIIVAQPGLGLGPQDIVFLGDPTPSMEPLNEAAEAISRTFEDKWKHPIESLPSDFSASLLGGLEAQLAEAIRKAGGIPTGTVPNTPVAGVSVEEFNQLKAQNEALMAQMAALTAKLSEPAEAKGRRV